MVWVPLVKALRKRNRIMLWDYPGLLAGEQISKDFSVSVPSLANYQIELLDAVSIDQACLVGWSLGPQVAIEIARNNQHRISAIVALCGTASSSFSDMHSEDPIGAVLGLSSSIPTAVHWLSERIDRIDRLRSFLKNLDHPTRWAKRFGFVDPIVDDILFDAVIKDFIALDPITYSRYLHAAAKHDASSILPKLKIPTLVVAGERDNLISPSKMRTMANNLKGAEFFEVRGGTHFLPLEYPALLALKIDDFLQRRISK